MLPARSRTNKAVELTRGTPKQLTAMQAAADEKAAPATKEGAPSIGTQRLDPRLSQAATALA